MSCSRRSLIFLGILLLLPTFLTAHCDTMDGPVIADARIALTRADITPVMKWVKPEFEPALQAAFLQTLKVRALSPDARDLADRYFFETLVRLHRAGEGAPFTGLKQEPVEPIVLATDAALAAGKLDPLLDSVHQDVIRGLQERFSRALEARKRANDNVAAGREYVEAYVALTHFVETLHKTLQPERDHDTVHLAENDR